MTASPFPPAYTERQLADATHGEFPAPEWIWMEQVLLSSRRVDAVAVSRYASRGQLLYGFEFKTSRADWRREVRNGLKAEEWAAFCDRWYVVAPPGVVHKGELPGNWGLYELHGERVVEVIRAMPLQCEPRTWALMVKLLSSALEGMAPCGEILAKERDFRTQAEAGARARVDQELADLRARVTQLTARVQEFAAFLGLQAYLPLERLMPFQNLYQALTDFVLRFERTALPFDRILPVVTDLVESAQAFVGKIERARAALTTPTEVDHPPAVP